MHEMGSISFKIEVVFLPEGMHARESLDVHRFG